jgi:hypothetical protein
MKRQYSLPPLFNATAFNSPGPIIWTLPPLVDTKISVKYNRRGEEDGKERQRTAGLHPGI